MNMLGSIDTCWDILLGNICDEKDPQHREKKNKVILVNLVLSESLKL